MNEDIPLYAAGDGFILQFCGESGSFSTKMCRLRKHHGLYFHQDQMQVSKTFNPLKFWDLQWSNKSLVNEIVAGFRFLRAESDRNRGRNSDTTQKKEKRETEHWGAVKRPVWMSKVLIDSISSMSNHVVYRGLNTPALWMTWYLMPTKAAFQSIAHGSQRHVFDVANLCESSWDGAPARVDIMSLNVLKHWFN